MGKTVAIYRKTAEGMQRIKTWTYTGNWRSSIREMCAQFFEEHPEITQEEKSEYFVANRRKVAGVYQDDKPLPMDTE